MSPPSPTRDAVPDGRAPTVFVSYSRKDLAFVDRLEPALRARGIEPLIDRSEIYAFEDWWSRLRGLIEQADTILFCLSPDSVSSEVCRREVDFAEGLNKRFAPVVVRAVDPALVPEALSRLNFVFLDTEERFAAGLDRLTEALSTDIDWVRRHSEYGALALDWAGKERPSSRLLRSPHLDEAEFWIARRPAGAPVPTPETQDLIVTSRRAATRRRNLVSTGLGLGLVLALVLASVALWQRQVAVRAEAEAVLQRDAAERNFAIAKRTVNSVIFDLARGLQAVEGIRLSVLKTVLTRVEAAMTRLTDAAPEDAELQSNRAAMLDEFGNTYRAAGDGPEALASFEQGLAIMRGLVRRDPAQAGWQRDLGAVLNKIGELKLAAGDAPGALAAFAESLAIRRALVARDPTQADWRNDLANSLIKVGDLHLRAGDPRSALVVYDESLVIRRALAEQAPDSTRLQRELVISLDKVGGAKLLLGDAAGALLVFEEGLIIREAIAGLDPDSTQARREWAVSLDRVGDVRLRLRAIPGALAAYEAALAIRRKLAAGDRDNAVWQRDVTVSLSKLGALRARAGDAEGARTAYEEWLGIARALVARDAGNTLWQRDLAACLFRLGGLRFGAGDRPGAAVFYAESLAIRREVARRDPDNATGQTDLAASLQNTADVVEDLALRRTLLDEALAILLRLQAAGKLPKAESGWPDEVRAERAKLG